MIKHKVEITYRDDKKETYDCVDYPNIGDKYLSLYIDKDFRKHISQEKISEFSVKDIGKKVGNNFKVKKNMLDESPLKLESFEITKRINGKLDSLKMILDIVLFKKDEGDGCEKMERSSLILELVGIEEKVTYLLDHIDM